MEKRNWLWKRKTSERSPGETESSESFSSHSEKYSDDQDGTKALPNDNAQSPEVTSKVKAISDEMDDSVKILTEKLSAALVNVSAKEDLVKQHSKVAEEAVAGWEKAENEAVLLKQQLEVAMQKNSALEDRSSHLDGALKECVRQLRQGREDQEQKIQKVVLEKTLEWESVKNDLNARLEFLERENTALKGKQTRSPSVDFDILQKLESLERENKSIKRDILSLTEELEIMTIERDLSAQAAENASKQNLDGIKKVAKLEAECRKLQMLNRKSLLTHDQKSISASSIYVESLTDSQSDSGERSNFITELDQNKNEKSLRASITGSPQEIDIMDDFLEMERLVALPKSETRDKKQKLDLINSDNQLKSYFEAMSHRVVELEQKLKVVEAENNEWEKVLYGSRSSYEENQLKADLEAMNHKVLEFEYKLRIVESEKIELEKALVSSRSSYEENKCKADFQEMSHKVVDLEYKLRMVEAEKNELEKVFEDSLSSFEVNQLRADLESKSCRVFELEGKLNTVDAEKKELQNLLDGTSYEENQLRADFEAKNQQVFELEGKLKFIEAEKFELEEALSASRSAYEESHLQLKNAERKIDDLQKELDIVNELKEKIEFQLTGFETEAQTKSSMIVLLKEEIMKEKSSSDEIAVRCRVLEEDIARKTQDIEVQRAAMENGQAKIEQEELDVAAGKLADCQKTIASLGRQLQSLATLEDFLIDTANIPGFSGDSEFWKLHSNGTKLPIENSNPLTSGDDDEKSPPSSSSSASSKDRNGFGKLFTRTKSGIQLENKQQS